MRKLRPKNKHDIIILVFDEIKNINEKLKKIIYDDVINSNLISYKEINSYIRKELKLKSYNIASYNYWKIRGWNEKEIDFKRIKLKSKNSPFKIETWLKKINPITNKNYSIEEAQYKIKSFKKINIEYWIKRGFSKNEAVKKVSNFQKKMFNKFKQKFKKNPENYKDIKQTQLNYWIKKCQTIDEAKQKLKERQNTISLEKHIKKYGEKTGSEIYFERCKKIGEKNKLKYYIEKYGEKKGIEKYLKRHSNNRKFKSSKEAFRFFIPIYKFLRKNGFDKEDIFWGIGKSKEYFITHQKNIYFYDFTIPKLKIIIEYNGIAFHANEKWNQEKKDKWKKLFSEKTYQESIEEDNLKKEVAVNKLFDYYSIYSDESLKNKQEEILNILKLKIKKYNGKNN